MKKNTNQPAKTTQVQEIEVSDKAMAEADAIMAAQTAAAKAKAEATAAKAKAKAAGCRGMVLETQSCNVAAIACYQKHGFRFIGLDTTCYTNDDIGKREVRLEMGLEFPEKEGKEIC